MNERIRQFLITENKSSAQFAEEIGVQPSGISHILSGRNKPSLDFIIKMLEKYQNLSVEWLLFGKGQMYREGNIMNLFDGNEKDKSADSEMQDNIQPDNVPEPPVKLPSEGERADSAHEKDLILPGVERNRIKKIVWFYKDNSFEEFYPASND